jgi:hypothetical protein
MPYRFASVLSYDAIDPVAQARFLRRLGAYAGRGLYSSVNPEGLRNPDVARLAGVRDLVDDPTAPPLDTAAFARATGFALVRVYDQPDGRIYRMDGALPAVSFFAHADRDPGLKRFFELLDAGDPSAVRRLFVDSGEAPAFPGGPGSIEYSRPFAERIEARVDAPAGGWLVVAEALDDGWEARVDGAPAPLYAANEVLRAVAVAPGRHEVVLRYRPRALLLGGLLSVLGAAGLVALATARRRPRGAVALDSPR